MRKSGRALAAWAVAAAFVALTNLPGRAWSAEPEASAESAPGSRQNREPSDLLSLIEGSSDAWSVSRTDAGCYLMSPYRKGSSRLEIGRHPTLGLGLFAVGLSLALPGVNGHEPVTIRAAGQELARSGRSAGLKILFVALAPSDVAAALRELADNGALWIVIKQTSIVHGGQAVQAALDLYAQTCADVPGTPG